MLETERDVAVATKDKAQSFEKDAKRKHRAHNAVVAALAQAEGRAGVAEVKLQVLQMQSQQLLAFAWSVVQRVAEDKQAAEVQHSTIEAALHQQLEVEAADADKARRELAAFSDISFRAKSKGRPYEDCVLMCYLELLGHGVTASICSKVVKTVLDNVPNMPEAILSYPVLS